MKTVYTSGQLVKLTETFEQKGVTSEHFQVCFSTGLTSDFAEAMATADLTKVNREEFRRVLGLGPASEPKRALTVWKTVVIGGGTPEQLINSVVNSCEEVGSNAKFLMTKITVSLTVSVTDLVVLTLRDLGLTSHSRTDAFMAKEFCEQWSY